MKPNPASFVDGYEASFVDAKTGETNGSLVFDTIVELADFIKTTCQPIGKLTITESFTGRFNEITIYSEPFRPLNANYDEIKRRIHDQTWFIMAHAGTTRRDQRRLSQDEIKSLIEWIQGEPGYEIVIEFSRTGGYIGTIKF